MHSQCRLGSVTWLWTGEKVKNVQFMFTCSHFVLRSFCRLDLPRCVKTCSNVHKIETAGFCTWELEKWLLKFNLILSLQNVNLILWDACKLTQRLGVRVPTLGSGGTDCSSSISDWKYEMGAVVRLLPVWHCENVFEPWSANLFCILIFGVIIIS